MTLYLGSEHSEEVPDAKDEYASIVEDYGPIPEDHFIEVEWMTKTKLKIYPDGKQYVSSRSWINKQEVRERSKGTRRKDKKKAIRLEQADEETI